jgi:putative FmdB family regulatory protein
MSILKSEEIMPIYEYECKDCGNRFEKLQPMTADPIKVCPNCGEERVRRIIHPAGIIFKGSGWYKTDTRKPPPSEGGSESSTASDKPAETKPSESTSTESKGAESKSTESKSVTTDKGSSSKESGS